MLGRLDLSSRVGEAALKRVREFYTELLDLEEGVGGGAWAEASTPVAPEKNKEVTEKSEKEKEGERGTPEKEKPSEATSKEDKKKEKKGDPAPEKDPKEKKKRRRREKKEKKADDTEEESQHSRTGGGRAPSNKPSVRRGLSEGSPKSVAGTSTRKKVLPVEVVKEEEAIEAEKKEGDLRDTTEEPSPREEESDQGRKTSRRRKESKERRRSSRRDRREERERSQRRHRYRESSRTPGVRGSDRPTEPTGPPPGHFYRQPQYYYDTYWGRSWKGSAGKGKVKRERGLDIALHGPAEDRKKERERKSR